MKKSTEYIMDAILSNMSALRELNEIDQTGVKKSIEFLKQMMETSKIVVVKNKPVSEPNDKQVFTGIKINSN